MGELIALRWDCCWEIQYTTERKRGRTFRRPFRVYACGWRKVGVATAKYL